MPGQQASGPGIFDLPAELRVLIFELSFAVGNFEDLEGYIALLKISSPDKSTLLVCRQFYREARPIYRRLYQTFWTDSKFIVRSCLFDGKVPLQAQQKEMLAKIKEIDLQHVSDLTSWLPERGGIACKGHELVDRRGLWRERRKDGRIKYSAFLPSTPQGQNHTPRASMVELDYHHLGGDLEVALSWLEGRPVASMRDQLGFAMGHF